MARLFPSRHLLVLNFHRVRDEASPFHDGMIEVSSKQFSEHITWIGRRADFVGEKDLLSLKPGGRPKVMLTFDDGYADAHEVVKPILEKAGIPASFFVAPGVLDQRKLGAWDRISYLVKKCPVNKFQFRGRDFSLEGGTRPLCLELGIWSQSSLPDRGDEFVAELASVIGVALPTSQEQSREILTWDQVRDLQRRGFSIGCHGLSHRVLSSLSLEEQEEEIQVARQRLSAEGISADS
ncbi:MAG: polysaccharide deacetylase family protein, partial [Bdellovibrionota bacterium]